MNRRSFFRVMPIAASPVALAATALAYSRPTDNLPPENAGVNFNHGEPVGDWQSSGNAPPAGGLMIKFQAYKNVRNQGALVMHDGELYIKKPDGPWRQVS